MLSFNNQFKNKWWNNQYQISKLHLNSNSNKKKFLSLNPQLIKHKINKKSCKKMQRT